MKIFCIKTTTGVAIMRLVDDTKEESNIEQFKISCPDMYVSHREIQEADIPTDRSQRDKWFDNGTKIIVKQ